MESAHDLLLGQLALELNFINYATLSAAKQVWVSRKGKSLGQVLVEREAITPRTLEVIENLVKLQTAKDASEEADKNGVSTADGTVGGTTEFLTPPAPITCAEAAIDGTLDSELRFRKVKPHAAGALGQVFIARDKELRRKVALKEIKDRFADSPDARSRFLLEAEITGRLEHPGVVPVYGMGTYANGRPFYAMRFIKGQSLADAIKELHAPSRNDSDGGLELRKLLGRFVAVCNTMQYAHDRDVVHRDLKPGNIMLGTYGETLVVDWGLAKIIGKTVDVEASMLFPATSDNFETLPGRAVGTITYMSPEQAAGRPEDVGPLSDIYGLGATLFSILTGRASVEDSLSEDQRRVDVRKLQRKVLEGRILRPRDLKPKLDRALEAICMKAMALLPGDRYPSARALADDLEKWLAGEPVSAYPEPPSVRMRRWVSRHRSLVVGAGVALLVGLGLTLSFATYLADAYSKMSTHYDELRAYKKETEDANSGRDAAITEETRARAEAKEATKQTASLKVEANRARKDAEDQKELLSSAEGAVAKAKKDLATASDKATEAEGLATMFRAAAEMEKKTAGEVQAQAARATKNAKDAEEAAAKRVKEAVAAERQATLTAQKRLAQIQTARNLLASAFKDLDLDADKGGIVSLKKQLVKRITKIAKELENETADDLEIWNELRAEVRSVLTSLGEGNSGPALPEEIQDTLDQGLLALRQGSKDPKKLDQALELAEKCRLHAEKLKAAEPELAAELHRDAFALRFDATQLKFKDKKAEADKVLSDALPAKLDEFHIPLVVYKLGHVARARHYGYKDPYFAKTIDEALQAKDVAARAHRQARDKANKFQESWWKDTEEQLLTSTFTCLVHYADKRFNETAGTDGGTTVDDLAKLQDSLKRYLQARDLGNANAEKRKFYLHWQIGMTFVNLGHLHKETPKTRLEMYGKARDELKLLSKEYRDNLVPESQMFLAQVEMALETFLKDR